MTQSVIALLPTLAVSTVLVSFPAVGLVEAPSAEDPLSDQTITCEEMQRYPSRVFSGEIDLGTGTGSPTDVEYDCPRSLANLPMMGKLLGLAEDIRAEHGRPWCTGSIIHAQWRYYQFNLLEAGYAPGLLLKDNASLESRSSQRIFEYLEFWSYQGKFNFNKHKSFLNEIRSVRPALGDYYRRQLGFSPQASRQLADQAIAIVVNRAAGSFPGDEWDHIQRDLETARIAQGPRATLTSWLPTADPSDLRFALQVALLTGMDNERIQLLLDHVDELNQGDESLLFFATSNRKNMRSLIGRGARVDYENGFGKTALYYAIQDNDLASAKYLVEAGADVNHRYRTPDKGDWDCAYAIEGTARTPLMHAAQHADAAMLNLLLRKGAKLDDLDGVKWNAADYAYERKRIDNERFLNERGLFSPRHAADACAEKLGAESLGAAVNLPGWSACFDLLPEGMDSKVFDD